MGASPVVQHLWREVSAVMPGDRPEFLDDVHFSEHVRVTQRSEHAAAVPQIGKVNVSREAIRERQSESIAALAGWSVPIRTPVGARGVAGTAQEG
jgi:hypothetical protein